MQSRYLNNDISSKNNSVNVRSGYLSTHSPDNSYKKQHEIKIISAISETKHCYFLQIMQNATAP